jgi:hypothetical protein
LSNKIKFNIKKHASIGEIKLPAGLATLQASYQSGTPKKPGNKKINHAKNFFNSKTNFTSNLIYQHRR